MIAPQTPQKLRRRQKDSEDARYATMMQSAAVPERGRRCRSKRIRTLTIRSVAGAQPVTNG